MLKASIRTCLVISLLAIQPLTAPAQETQAAEDPDSLRPLTIAAVGDMMLGTDFPTHRLAEDDGASLLADPTPILSGADIAFGNLEGVLLDGGEPVKQCSDPGSCYLFRSPTHYADLFAKAGFTVMSLANNHARDFGEEGRTSSMEALAARGIHHSGRIGDVASWEVDGSRIAMVAFAPFKGANDLLDIPAAAILVEALASDHDIVIVSIHAGGEAGDVSHVPFEEEHFRGENRGDVALFSRTVVDAGADLVIGHGPHVPRGVEVYKDRLISYSLGNFATYYGIRVTGVNGLAPLLVVQVDRDGRFLEGQIHSYRQRRPRGPVTDSSREVARRMQQLSAEDFPDSSPEFDDTGKILPR